MSNLHGSVQYLLDNGYALDDVGALVRVDDEAAFAIFSAPHPDYNATADEQEACAALMDAMWANADAGDAIRARKAGN